MNKMRRFRDEKNNWGGSHSYCIDIYYFQYQCNL
jgi:hypothetical protein